MSPHISSALLPSSHTSINVFLVSPSLSLCHRRLGFSGFLHSQQLSPRIGTRFAKSCCMADFVSIAYRPWYSARSTWSRKLWCAGFVCSWNMRDVDWRSCGDGLGWRKGRAGTARGGVGREFVESERVCDIPKGDETGPFGVLLFEGAGWLGCVAAGVRIEACCCSLGFSSTSASAGPRRNRIGLRLRHASAAFSSRKITRLALGCERASYLRFLKYSTSPNCETRRSISRESLMLDGRGVIRRCTARPAVDRASDAIVISRMWLSL
jgi:hypothetical protein